MMAAPFAPTNPDDDATKLSPPTSNIGSPLQLASPGRHVTIPSDFPGISQHQMNTFTSPDASSISPNAPGLQVANDNERSTQQSSVSPGPMDNSESSTRYSLLSSTNDSADLSISCPFLIKSSGPCPKDESAPSTSSILSLRSSPHVTEPPDCSIISQHRMTTITSRDTSCISQEAPALDMSLDHSPSNSPCPMDHSASSTSCPLLTSTSPGPLDHSTPSVSNQNQASSSTSHDQSKKSTEIGPYATDVGLTTNHFLVPIREAVFPQVTTIKNGLILELYEYLTVKLNYPNVSVVHVLMKLTSQENLNEKGLSMAIKRLWNKRCKLIRDWKKKNNEQLLKELREGEFQIVRIRVGTAKQETPRKRKLRFDLKSEKVEHRKVKRKLSTAEGSMASLNQRMTEQEGIEEALKVENAQEKVARLVAEEATFTVEQEKLVLEEEKMAVESDLYIMQQNVDTLQQKYDAAITQLNEVNLKFNPLQDDLDDYTKRFKTQSKQVEVLNKAYDVARKKMSTFNVRNVNKRIKTRETQRDLVTDERDKLGIQQLQMSNLLKKMRDELDDTQAKLNMSKKEKEKLEERMSCKAVLKTKVDKAAWKLRKQKSNNEDAVKEMYTEADFNALDERVEILQKRVRELEDMIALLDDEEITTFQDGKYTDEVRETIMALLSMNVATSKVNEVIRVVLKNLAKKSITRLPSVGTISEIRLEASHLADLEVGLAMRENRPEDALGNCIHGDGTTKYHKKYQNWQVTLPDGTSRSMGLTQMAAADTDAVVLSYQDRIRELAAAVSGVEESEADTVYEELLCTVKSAMTDQGPTMPQFGARLKIIREELLPKLTPNWENMPENVKKSMGQFGQFYCKMHPLINFAEESNRVLKSLEDISTNGKNAHTLLTSEAGATRLIRTASKAFHHRGSDQSGVEEAFTTYLHYEYEVKNHLVHYVGNRANILFEGAAAAYYHLDHMINFVGHLPDPNQLLLAVTEDAQEKIHRAELRALGMIHKCVTEPLWETTKSTENILSLNDSLHYLQLKLIEWKEDASPLMLGEMGVEGAEYHKDEISEALFKECHDVELQGMTQQALELLCCALLLILERQCKDQLPGGKYWDPSLAVMQRYNNVPTTNVVGERDFAWLDFLVRQKPSARITTLETIIMWANNGTRVWLDGLDPTTKATYMEQARAHAPEILQRYKSKMVTIKRQLWEKLQKKQKEKAAKEAKQLAARVKLTNEIAGQGGVWCTLDIINAKCDELFDNATEEEARRAIHTQLSFHLKVLKSQVPKKEFAQLSATTDGKNRKFTKSQMKENLIKVVQANNMPSDPADVTQPSTPPRPVTYTEPETQQQLYDVVKRNLFTKIAGERTKRATEQSKNNLGLLVQNPRLLLNKQVQHHCVDTQGVPRWFDGKIIDVKPFPSDDTNLIITKSLYTIKYEDSQLEDEEDRELNFNLLVDLKKNDLIILDPIT